MFSPPSGKDHFVTRELLAITVENNVRVLWVLEKLSEVSDLALLLIHLVLNRPFKTDQLSKDCDRRHQGKWGFFFAIQLRMFVILMEARMVLYTIEVQFQTVLTKGFGHLP